MAHFSIRCSISSIALSNLTRAGRARKFLAGSPFWKETAAARDVPERRRLFPPH
jgi:hypothetical protein